METLGSKEPQGILVLRVQLDQLVHLDRLVNQDLWEILVPLGKPEELDSQGQLDLLEQQVTSEISLTLRIKLNFYLRCSVKMFLYFWQPFDTCVSFNYYQLARFG